MAGPTSDWLRDEWTKYAYLTDAMGTRPDGWEVALIKDDGEEVDAADDANYARQAVTFETFGQTGRVRNEAAVSFPEAEEGADYTVVEFEVHGTNVSEPLKRAPLAEGPQNVTEGQTVSFAAGDLVVGVD